jgi:hypothetical protein
MIKNAQDISGVITQMVNNWNDIKVISSNASKTFQLNIDNIYKSLQASSKDDLDPIVYLFNQGRAQQQQEFLFREIQKTENQLVSKYNLIKGKLKDRNILSSLVARSNSNTQTQEEKALFGDNPAIAAENLDREVDLIKLDFDNMKATIVNKSVTLSRANEVRELKNRFEYSVKKMDASVEKIAYVGDIIQYGYSLANLYKEISDEFSKKSENSAYEPFKDVLEHNSEEYDLKALSQKILTDTKALPGLYQRLGLDTKPSGDIPSNVSLSELKADMKRFATDKPKEAKNRYTEYWDSLMMQSLDPVELGTIIYEKPKHGDKTIKEEQNLHGTKFKKNMMKKSKPRFKKDK